MVTVILWVSRHNILPSQLKTLHEKLGNIRVVMLRDVIPNAEYVAEKAKEIGAKIVIPVLPLSMIARLVDLKKKYGFEVVMARMEAIAQTKDLEEAKRIVNEAPDRRTVATYSDGTIKVYEFKGFEKVNRVTVETEPW